MTPLQPTSVPASWQRLLEKSTRFPLEEMLLSNATDTHKQLRRQFDPAFPLEIHSYCFPDYQDNLGDRWLNTHDYLELIVPTKGTGRFCMGAHAVEFSPGDLLIVQNRMVHGVTECDGEPCSLVLFFLPELIFGPGSLPFEHDYLSPFFGRRPNELPILRRDDRMAETVHQALIALLDAYEERRGAATCKLHLLQVLEALRHCFKGTNLSPLHYRRHRQCLRGVHSVIDHLRENFAEPLSLTSAAAKAGMSLTLFKQSFKAVTGTTWNKYCLHLRLTEATRLLRETDLTIGEIAHAAGFSDQSYFDRRFRERFRKTPREYRHTSPQPIGLGGRRQPDPSDRPKMMSNRTRHDWASPAILAS